MYWLLSWISFERHRTKRLIYVCHCLRFVCIYVSVTLRLRFVSLVYVLNQFLGMMVGEKHVEIRPKEIMNLGIVLQNSLVLSIRLLGDMPFSACKF